MTRRCRDDGGIVLVYFALAMVVIMGMTALVIDVGYWYFQSFRIQKAADAAALAGVVYMPGAIGQAQTAADALAKSNGFDPSKYTVTASPVPNEPNQLSVSITDPTVPTFFAKLFGMLNVSETRTAIAEYDPAIPLGSPENSIGTGNLNLGAGTPTNIWAAINGYCTSKENGDELASWLDATWNGSTWTCSSTSPSSSVHNYEYNSEGYFYDVQTPSQSGTLSSPLTIQAYDPAYEPSGCSGHGTSSPDLSLGSNTTITTSYALTYAPVPFDHTKDQPVPGVTSPVTYSTGDSASCGNWVTLFTIPSGQPNGEYRLEVSTQAGQANSDGSNSYAFRAYQGSWSRCTTIPGISYYSASCPTITGESDLSVYANQNNSTGSFYLASIDSQYAGHIMAITLFDPGEGDHYIQVLDPNGNPVPFTYQTTDQTTGCPDCASQIGFRAYSGSSTGSPGLDVSGTISPPPGEDSNSIYNDRHVQLTVQIPTTYTAPNGGWWKIKYTSTSQITDRTTWSVSIYGGPIHLLR